MKQKIIFLCALVLIGISGCATTTQTVTLGAGVGAAIGGGVGYAYSDRDLGATVAGNLIGAAVGGTIAYFAHQEQEARKQKSQAQATKDPFLKNDPLRGNPHPLVTKPKVKVYKVEDKVVGNKYIKGHKVYVIDQPAAWSKTKDKEFTKPNSTKKPDRKDKPQPQTKSKG